MQRALGKILIAFVVVLVLLAAAALVLPLMLDQERFRERIERELSDVSGYPLEIAAGPFLRLLPSPLVELKGVALAPAADEDTPPLAAAQSLRVHVAVMPFLSGRLVVNGIALDGLQASVQIREDGRGNWELGEAGSVSIDVPPAAAALAGAASYQTFSLPQSLLLRNAMLSLRGGDGSTGLSWRLRDLGNDPTLSAGPLELLGSFQIDAPQAMLQGSWQIQATLEPGQEPDSVRLTALRLAGADLAAGQAQLLDLDFRASGSIRTDTGRWSVDELVLTSGPLRAHAQLAADALRAPVSGTMRIAGFDFRHWLHANGYGPLPGEPETLRCVAARSGVTLADGKLSLVGIALRIDEANAAGEARIALRPLPVVAASVALDRIDLDAYLAPPGEGQTSGGDLSGEDCAGELVAAEGRAPGLPEAVGGAPLNLRIETGELRLGGLAYRGVSIDSRLAAGVLGADINASEFYGGQLATHVERGVGSSATTPTSVLAHASGVDIAALLADLQGSSPMVGTGEFTAELVGSRDPLLFAGTLAGNVALRVHDARFTGFDIGAALRRAGVAADEALEAA
ncbi:MAG: AsmA family protein, partial [Thiohalocapsa sp.]|nr:AsmA family protein [Thiohalocapsa sp.]